MLGGDRGVDRLAGDPAVHSGLDTSLPVPRRWRGDAHGHQFVFADATEGVSIAEFATFGGTPCSGSRSNRTPPTAGRPLGPEVDGSIGRPAGAAPATVVVGGVRRGGRRRQWRRRVRDPLRLAGRRVGADVDTDRRRGETPAAPTASGVWLPGSGAASRTDRGLLLGAEPSQLVGPDEHRGHQHQRRQQGDRDVEGDDDAEVAQQRQRRRISTPKPPMIVSADVKKARPVRAAPCGARPGPSPSWRSSMCAPMISTENSAHAGDHQRARHRGERAERESAQPTTSDECRSRGTPAPAPAPPAQAARAQHEVQPGEAEREVGERGAVGGEVLEQADADRGEAGGHGAHRLLPWREFLEQDAVGRGCRARRSVLEIGAGAPRRGPPAPRGWRAPAGG